MTHILIVNAKFYPALAEELLEGAIEVLNKEKITYETVEVPGAFEIPAAVSFGIQTKKFDGYIALGCVIRGETSHYDYVCGESARGLNDLTLKYSAPIGYGIVTTENEKQAKVRIDRKKGNKGAAAAEACLQMLKIKKQFKI